jgi:uncharacterized protein YdiU (UPF0061 family)
MNENINKDKDYEDKDFQNWKVRWNERLKINSNTPEKYLKLMKTVNPLVIPRNHNVEKALKATEKNNLKPITKLIEVLKDPYTKKNNINDYQDSSNSDENYKTFCGT